MEEDELASGNNNRLYGNKEPASWGFDALDTNNNADSDADMLLDSVHDNEEGNDDVNSTAAERDSDRDFDDPPDLIWGDDHVDSRDDHSMYSDTRAYHVEDTNMTSDDPPAVDITLSDNDPHSKMD